MSNYVYMFLNELEEPLYIGISIRLVQRIEAQHFRGKTGNLSKECIEETHKILYHQATSADDMKIKERYLINKLNPKYNDKMNNRNEFNYSISVEWEEYEFNKEELLKKREDNEYKSHSKFRNYSYDFQNQAILKLNSERTIQTFSTCLLNYDEYFPNLQFPERNWGGYNPLDDFYFLKINNELYIFCKEVLLNFYNTNYPGDGSVEVSIKDIEELRNEYGLESFIIVGSKEKKGIFGGGDYIEKLPYEVLFMNYKKLKETKLLSEEWENLLDKAIVNNKKPHYEFLLGRCLTKKENENLDQIINEKMNRLYNKN